jgi:hypothetical protein
MDSLGRCPYDVRELLLLMIGAWPDRRMSVPGIAGVDKEATMSEETAREVAEREIGRTSDEKRKTPERRAFRTGNGRRRNNGSKRREQGTEAPPRPTPRSSGAPSGDQRRFNRT